VARGEMGKGGLKIPSPALSQTICGRGSERHENL
jgi:hypothetical protein